MLDYRIKTFLNLCKLMNYRKTAEKLNMTQPAVTQHIQYLEEIYDCKLFTYEQRILKITKEGKILKSYVENISYQEEKLFSALKEKKGKYHLTIGATKTIGEFIIGDQISKFLENSINTLSVNIDNTEKIINDLEEGKIDFAIVEGFFDKHKFKYKLYNKENFVGICSKNHKFAKRIISFEELYTETIILRENGSGTRDIFEQILAEENFSIESFSRVIFINNFKVITQLVENKLGVTFAYKSILNRNEDLEVFHIRDSNIIREFNYIFLNNNIAEEAVDYFETFR